MAARFWDPAVAVDEDQLLDFTPGPQGVGGALFALHRHGATALLEMPAPAFADAAAVRDILDDLEVLPYVAAVSKSMPGESAAHFVCDEADAAGAAAVMVFSTAISKGVAAQTALARAAAVYGVPASALGAYLPLSADPASKDAAIQDAADRLLLGHVTAVASAEIAKADERPVASRVRAPLDDYLDQQLARVGQPETETEPRDEQGRWTTGADRVQRTVRTQRTQRTQRLQRTVKPAEAPVVTRATARADRTLQRRDALERQLLRAAVSLGSPERSMVPTHESRDQLPVIEHTVSVLMTPAAYENIAGHDLTVSDVAHQGDATRTGDEGYHRDVAEYGQFALDASANRQVPFKPLDEEELKDVERMAHPYPLGAVGLDGAQQRAAEKAADEAQANDTRGAKYEAFPNLVDGQYDGTYSILDLAKHNPPTVVDVQIEGARGDYQRSTRAEDDYVFSTDQHLEHVPGAGGRLFFDRRHGVLVQKVTYRVVDDGDVTKAQSFQEWNTTHAEQRTADGKFGSGLLSDDQLDALLNPTREQRTTRAQRTQRTQRVQRGATARPEVTRSGVTRAQDRGERTLTREQQVLAQTVAAVAQERQAQIPDIGELSDHTLYTVMQPRDWAEMMDIRGHRSNPQFVNDLQPEEMVDFLGSAIGGTEANEQVAEDTRQQLASSRTMEYVLQPVYGDPKLHTTRARIEAQVNAYFRAHPNAVYSRTLVEQSQHDGELRHDITMNMTETRPQVVIQHSDELNTDYPAKLTYIGLRRLSGATPKSERNEHETVAPVVHLYRLENDDEHGLIYGDHSDWER